MGFDTFCCDMMARNVSCEGNDVFGNKTIFYSKRFDEYMLPCSESSGICIEYCPWCGRKLPESKRERWFEELDQLGIDFSLLDTEQVPEAYLSDQWWRSHEK